MTGGILQLAAKGIEDGVLINNSQITFFKTVFKKHTNFLIETVSHQFSQYPNFGKRISTKLSHKNGDLIRKMYLVIELPEVHIFHNILKFAWVYKVGFAIIKSIELEIGNYIIDKLYGDWLNIWYELTIGDNYSEHYKYLIGDIKEMTNLSNKKNKFDLVIPLQFWFNRIIGSTLPILLLGCSDIKINLDINQFNKCCILAPSHYIDIDNDFINFIDNEYLFQEISGSTAKFIDFDIIEKKLYILLITNNGFITTDSKNDKGLDSRYQIRGLTSKFAITIKNKEHKYNDYIFEPINLKKVNLLVEYIFLNNIERNKLLNSNGEYLIEQIVYNGENVVNNIFNEYNINFDRSCKEIIWVTQLNILENKNDQFNYTDSLIRVNDKLIGHNLIKYQKLLFNEYDLFRMHDPNYCSWLQQYRYHTHSSNEGINVYSFSLHPEISHQPSGSINLNQVDNIKLIIKVNNKINFQNPAVIRIYGITYNILKINDGLCRLLF